MIIRFRADIVDLIGFPDTKVHTSLTSVKSSLRYQEATLSPVLLIKSFLELVNVDVDPVLAIWVTFQHPEVKKNRFEEKIPSQLIIAGSLRVSLLITLGGT